MKALAALVLVHLAVSIAHGAAHAGAGVTLGPAGMLFVFVVVTAGPIAGLLIAIRRPALGGSIVALTMAGSLVFGLVNHFVIDGTDHVGRVAAAWRSVFASTAALLVVVEAAGAAAGALFAIRVRRTS
jgi:hypothetical protein